MLVSAAACPARIYLLRTREGKKKKKKEKGLSGIDQIATGAGPSLFSYLRPTWERGKKKGEARAEKSPRPFDRPLSPWGRKKKRKKRKKKPRAREGEKTGVALCFPFLFTFFCSEKKGREGKKKKLNHSLPGSAWPPTRGGGKERKKGEKKPHINGKYASSPPRGGKKGEKKGKKKKNVDAETPGGAFASLLPLQFLTSLKNPKEKRTVNTRHPGRERST